MDLIDIVLEGLKKMLVAFMRLTVPTFAAICSGAVAGAFVLALAHDYRFMSMTHERPSSSPELYMLELDLGLPIPSAMMALIRSKLGPSALRDVVLGANKLNAQTALEKGIVDAVFEDSAATLDAAVKEAEKLAGRGWEREIYRDFRLVAFPGVLEALNKNAPYRIPPSFNFS